MFHRLFAPRMVDADSALPGRDSYPFEVPTTHAVLGSPIQPPFADGLQTAVFGMGCFWGAERIFWKRDGVVSTAVGYAGGFTPHPTYEETCSGKTGHTEVVLVVFDPSRVSYDEILALFWESHDPTQGMRQGNDSGTQYRSAAYWNSPEQKATLLASRERYQQGLNSGGFGDITTELAEAGTFWYAEGYHQQYLHKNPGGYCGIGGTGVSCPIGVGVEG